MKTKSLFLSLAIATFLTSAIPSANHSLEIGEEAPQLSLSSSSDAVIPSGHSKTVLLFWSASDPASRVANHRLSKIAESENNENVRFVSISIDKDTALASMIEEADGISDKVISLHRDDISADVLRDYQTSTGCRTFTIDSYGILRHITSPI